MLEKWRNKRLKKHYAVFFDENGVQLDIKKIPNHKNVFEYDKKTYTCDSDRYTNLKLTKGLKTSIYWFYDIRYSEPLNYSKEFIAHTTNGKPYIAEQIHTIIQSKILEQVNRKEHNFLDNILSDPRKLIMIVIVIGIGVYLFINGGA
jgi:NAD-specific glutamate dehydrogenase